MNYICKHFPGNRICALSLSSFLSLRTYHVPKFTGSIKEMYAKSCQTLPRYRYPIKALSAELSPRLPPFQRQCEISSKRRRASENFVVHAIARRREGGKVSDRELRCARDVRAPCTWRGCFRYMREYFYTPPLLLLLLPSPWRGCNANTRRGLN